MRSSYGTYYINGTQILIKNYPEYDYLTTLGFDKEEKQITFYIPDTYENNKFSISIFETREERLVNGWRWCWFYQGYCLYATPSARNEKLIEQGETVEYRTYNDIEGEEPLNASFYGNTEIDATTIDVFKQCKALDKIDIIFLETGETEYYINDEFIVKRPKLISLVFRMKEDDVTLNCFAVNDYLELPKYECYLTENQINVDFLPKNYAYNAPMKYYLSINSNDYKEMELIEVENFFRHIINNAYWGIYSLRLKIENKYKTFYSEVKTINIKKAITLKENDKSDLILLYDILEDDFRHNGIGKINPIQAKITETSGNLIAEFKLLNNERNKLIKIGSFIKCKVDNERNNQLFRVRSIVKDNNYITVYCYCYLINDLGDNYVKDINITSKTAIESIQHLLDNTIIENDFKVTGAETEALNPILERKNFKNLIFDTENSIISNYNCTVTIDNDKLIVNKNNKELIARDRKNIIEIEQDIDDYDICTCVVPYSNDGYGIDEVYVLSPLVNSYPSIHTQEVIFQDINISNQYPTVEKVKQALREKTKELFSVNMIDVPYQNFVLKIFEDNKISRLTLYDTVLCRHKRLDIEFTATVIQREYNPLSNRNTSITLGVNRKTLSEVFRTNKIKEIEKGITAFATKKYVELQSQSLAEAMESEMLDLTVNNVEMDYRLCQLQLGI